MRLISLAAVPLLCMLPGCTAGLLRDIASEKDVRRELMRLHYERHHGHDAGEVTLNGIAYRDYRFADCLVERQHTRTLRVLVPTALDSKDHALVSETNEVVPEQFDVAIAFAADSDDKATPTEAWREYFFNQSQLRSEMPLLVLFMSQDGTGTILFDDVALNTPQVRQIPARADLRYVARSPGKHLVQHLLLPVAVAGDAGMILILGVMTGGMRP